MVEKFLHFLFERYDRKEVRSWYFEVWNEPDLPIFFKGKQKDYFKLYEATARTIKKVDDKLLVGGPATRQGIDDTHCNPKAEWIRLGKPDLLTPAQAADIKRKTRLSEEQQEFTTDGNTTKLTVSLRTNDVILLTLT